MHLIQFILITVLPGFVYGYWSCDSYAPGVAASSLLLLFISQVFYSNGMTLPSRSRFFISIYFWVFVVFSVHIFFVVNVGGNRDVDYSRFAYSLLLLGLVLVGSKSASLIWESFAFDALRFARVCTAGLLAILVASKLGVSAWDQNLYPKSVCVFPEPSHFALILAPFTLYLAASGGTITRLAIIGGMAALGVSLESLLLLIAAIMTCVLTCRFSVTVFFTSLTSLVLVAMDRHGYFLERINYSGSIQNLSLLVYLNGWDMALSSLQDSGGLGVGFQQLGYSMLTEGNYADEIVRQVSVSLNHKDGGFLAAKIICELGVVGVAITATAVIFGVRSALIIRKSALSYSKPEETEKNKTVVFCHCISATFLLELLLRGGGYFTVGTSLYFAGLIYLASPRLFTRRAASLIVPKIQPDVGGGGQPLSAHLKTKSE